MSEFHWIPTTGVYPPCDGDPRRLPMKPTEVHWIPVSEQLPRLDGETSVGAMVVVNGDWINMDRYTQEGWWRFDERVTHWAPMPPLPKRRGRARKEHTHAQK